MGLRFDFAVVVEAISSGVGAILSFIPKRQFHRQRGKECRLDSAPSQAGTDGELGALVGRRTRSVAAAVVELGTDMQARFAFVGADANTRFEIGSVTKGLTVTLSKVATKAELMNMWSPIPPLV